MREAGGSGSATLLDLPTCFAEGAIDALRVGPGGEASWSFSFVTSDPSLFTLDILQKPIYIHATGTYVLFCNATWAIAAGFNPPGTDRIIITPSFLPAHPKEYDAPLTDNRENPAHLDAQTGATNIWECDFTWLLDVQDASTPIEVHLFASIGSSGTADATGGDTELMIARVRETPLGQAF